MDSHSLMLLTQTNVYQYIINTYNNKPAAANGFDADGVVVVAAAAEIHRHTLVNKSAF